MTWNGFWIPHNFKKIFGSPSFNISNTNHPIALSASAKSSATPTSNTIMGSHLGGETSPEREAVEPLDVIEIEEDEAEMMEAEDVETGPTEGVDVETGPTEVVDVETEPMEVVDLETKPTEVEDGGVGGGIDDVGGGKGKAGGGKGKAGGGKGKAGGGKGKAGGGKGKVGGGKGKVGGGKGKAGGGKGKGKVGVVGYGRSIEGPNILQLARAHPYYYGLRFPRERHDVPCAGFKTR